MDNKSKLGYSKNSPYKNEPYINIKSNKITMKDTDKDILGIGIKNGKPVKVISMKAGESENYDFGDVDSVLEVPKFQNGSMFMSPEDKLAQMNASTVFPMTRLGNTGTMVGANKAESYFNPTNTSLSEYEADAASQDIDADIMQSQQFGNFLDIQQKENKTQTDQLANQQYQDNLNEAVAAPGVDQDNPYNNQQPQYNQYFNPYGGVDLETAWAGFGRGLGSKENKGLTALYGAKSILGTARNLLGGFASEKRNQYVNQYYQDQQQLARNGQYTYAEDGGVHKYQDGGTNLTQEDIEQIRQASGVMFTDQKTNELFQTVPGEQQLPDVTPVNLGRFKDVNYFDVIGQDNDTIKLRNTQYNPHNAQTIGDLVNEVRTLNPGRKVEFQYMENGGVAKKLTGEYIEGEANDNPERAVAEIEDGEYMQSPNGDVVEVEGEKHENGGEKMTAEQMESGTRVVSDNLKIGKDNAKYFRDKYEIKLKAKDTYATVLDKVSKKIGLKEIVEEQEEVIEKMSKNQEGEDETTQKLNLQFLSKKLKDLEEKKLPLEEARKGILDDVYTKQEESKPKEEKDETVMEDGGEFDSSMIEAMASKHNIPYETALNLVKEFKKGGKYDIPKYQDGTNRLDNFFNSAKARGYEGKKEIGELQKWMASNYPQEVVNYFEQIPITAKGVDIIKKQYPELLKKSGLKEKPSAEYTTEEKQMLTNLMKEEGTYTQDFILDQFQDNKFEYRAPILSTQIETQGVNIDPMVGVTPELMTRPSTATTPITPETQSGSQESSTDSQGMSQIPLLPRQDAMMPGAMSPHLKNTYRFGRIDYLNRTPEQQLSEIGRQMNTTMASLNQVPDSQRAAALAQIMAGSGQASNQAIAQTEALNAQGRMEADRYNVGAMDKEMIANNRERERLERLQYRAKDITEQDWRDYQQYSQKVNLANYNAIQNMNLLNQLYDQYGISPTGQVQFRNPVDINVPKIK